MHFPRHGSGALRTTPASPHDPSLVPTIAAAESLARPPQVTGDGKATVSSTIAKTCKEKGIVGFYPGGVAIAFRQATNWASRQVGRVRGCARRLRFVRS